MTDTTETHPQQNLFLRDVQAEFSRGLTFHGLFNSLHEAYAVLLEEVDELWEECRKKESKRKASEIRRELVQIAAVAWKTAHSFDLESLSDDEPF